MAGSVFGVGSPISYPTSQPMPFGLSPYGAQGLSTPFAQPQTPFAQPQSGQPLQQILQVLQIVPHQLQHLQQLVSVQQQQLQQVQQLLQVVPAQLAQLQQLIQFVPQQIQQMQQPSPVQQPFGQTAGPGGFAATPPWGNTPQVFGQSGQVM